MPACYSCGQRARFRCGDCNVIHFCQHACYEHHRCTEWQSASPVDTSATVKRKSNAPGPDPQSQKQESPSANEVVLPILPADVLAKILDSLTLTEIVQTVRSLSKRMRIRVQHYLIRYREELTVQPNWGSRITSDDFVAVLIRDATALKRLNLPKNYYPQLHRALLGNTSLRELKLGDARYVRGLKGTKPNLHTLDLSNTRIEDVSNLPPSIRTLDLSNLPSSIRTLDLSNTEIEDVSNLPPSISTLIMHDAIGESLSTLPPPLHTLDVSESCLGESPALPHTLLGIDVG